MQWALCSLADQGLAFHSSLRTVSVSTDSYEQALTWNIVPETVNDAQHVYEQGESSHCYFNTELPT